MSVSAAILGVGFVSPLLLGGLGLAVVPLIIHLLSRRRFIRVEWAATRFLLEAERENRRRVQFEQWLLVALRCLALALLALLMARPFAESRLVAALLGGTMQTQRFIVIDDSASLANRDAARMEFESLKSAADRLLVWLDREAPGDRVSVFRATHPEQPLAADLPLSDPRVRDLQDAIGRLEPTAGRARPQRVLAAIAERLRAAPRVPAEIVLLSDFQRSDWLEAAAANQSAFAALRNQSGSPASAMPPIRLMLVGAGSETRPNIGITGLRLVRPQTIAGLPAVALAEITNYAARPLPAGSLQIQLDDSPQPAMPFEAIDGGASRTVTFETTVADEGWHTLSTNLGAIDGFAPDDARRIGLHVSAALRVLLVNGQPSADRAADEVHLLRNAISPPGPFTSGIRVDTIDPDELDGTDLTPYDAVLLCNVAAPEESAVAVLADYVRGGGGLAIFLGSEVDSEAYRRRFGGGTALVPVPLLDIVTVPDGVGLVRAADHPITAMFPEGGESLSEYVRFRRFFRTAETTPTSDAADSSAPDMEGSAPATQPRGARVLARFTDDGRSAALLESAVGRGRVLLFTSSIDLDWNDWARSTDGSYVVTMLELVQYVARRSEQPHEYIGGEPFRIALMPETYELRGLLKTPAYPNEAALEIAAATGDVAPGTPVILTGPIADRLGVYQLELTTRAGMSETRPLAVDLDPRESELTNGTRAALSAAIGDIPHQFAGPADEFLRDEAESRREFWPALLLMLVIVLTLEQTLAWRFGAHRAVTRAAPRPRTTSGPGPRPTRPIARLVEDRPHAAARSQ